MITKQQFEAFVPAFRDVEPRIFETVVPFLHRYFAVAVSELGVPADADDALLMRLLELFPDEPPRSCSLLRALLLGCPMLARRYGITVQGGARVCEDEFQTLKPDLFEAQAAIRRLVGDEQEEALRKLPENTPVDTPEAAAAFVLREKCRKLMVCMVMKKRPGDVRNVVRDIRAFLDGHADTLPLYRKSSKYAADHFTPYQNEKNDPTFFFG